MGSKPTTPSIFIIFSVCELARERVWFFCATPRSKTAVPPRAPSRESILCRQGLQAERENESGCSVAVDEDAEVLNAAPHAEFGRRDSCQCTRATRNPDCLQSASSISTSLSSGKAAAGSRCSRVGASATLRVSSSLDSVLTSSWRSMSIASCSLESQQAFAHGEPVTTMLAAWWARSALIQSRHSPRPGTWRKRACVQGYLASRRSDR